MFRQVHNYAHIVFNHKQRNTKFGVCDPQAINQTIYQCGVDTHHSDPLADMSLTHQIYFHLANKIMGLSVNTCDKLLVLFGGGYNSNKSVISYFNIMCGLLNKDGYINE